MLFQSLSENGTLNAVAPDPDLVLDRHHVLSNATDISKIRFWFLTYQFFRIFSFSGSRFWVPGSGFRFLGSRIQVTSCVGCGWGLYKIWGRIENEYLEEGTIPFRYPLQNPKNGSFLNLEFWALEWDQDLLKWILRNILRTSGGCHKVSSATTE